MILLALLAQVVDMSGWSPSMVFAYAVLTVIGPWVLAAIGTVTLFLKLRSVEKSVNGRMTELLSTKDTVAEVKAQAARAEGALEEHKAAPPVPAVVLVQPGPGTPPTTVSAPGGRRADDKIPTAPATPLPVEIQNSAPIPVDDVGSKTRPPPEVDPTSHSS